MAASPRSRKPAAKTATDLPANVALNLDTYELEDNERGPFTFVLGGKPITLIDPRQVAWQDLADIDSPYGFAEACMTEKDREHFLEHRLPAGKLNELMRRFRAHYGMGEPGNSGA